LRSDLPEPSAEPSKEAAGTVCPRPAQPQVLCVRPQTTGHRGSQHGENQREDTRGEGMLCIVKGIELQSSLLIWNLVLYCEGNRITVKSAYMEPGSVL